MSDLSLAKAIAISNFNSVMVGFPADEIEIIKTLYRESPEAYRYWFEILAAEIPQQPIEDTRFVPITPDSYPVNRVKRA